jgi:hypothetical protein
MNLIEFGTLGGFCDDAVYFGLLGCEAGVDDDAS